MNCSKICLLLGLIGLHAMQLLANDGVFYAEGGQLFPIQETVVQLQKEVLKLKRQGDFMAVDVYFEFYNPGPAKSVIVGFVTPPAEGDVDPKVAAHPQIKDFSVEVNAKMLQYKVTTLQNSEFKLDEEVFPGFDFVYYFDVDFKPGLNIIHHQYQFRGGSSTELEFDFGYRLTTGNMWANGEIGDFTLEVDMGERALFSLPWSFQEDGTAAHWQLIGKGKLGLQADSFFERAFAAAYTSKGIVQMKQLHFHPAHDLGILGLQHINQAYGWGRPDLAPEVNKWLGCAYFSGFDPDCMEDLSDFELKLMRNYFFAKRGLVFKTKALSQYFGQFVWYDPIPSLKMSEIQLEKWEQESVTAIQKEEKRRSGK